MIVQVAVDLPQIGPLDYELETDNKFEEVKGRWVLIPLRNKLQIGLILGKKVKISSHVKLKKVHSIVTQLPKMNDRWLSFAIFASNYYHKSIGQTVFSSMPRTLKDHKTYLLGQKKNKEIRADQLVSNTKEKNRNHPQFEKLHLNQEQKKAVKEINASEKPVLLHGVTGSGKTRVYAEIIQQTIKKYPTSQILLLVPEIGLTPQLEKNMREMLKGVEINLFHSEQTALSRSKVWISSSMGFPSLIIGTRLSVFLPLPKLNLVIVDEEHDTSFKQQEGLRYSAKNLALWRVQSVSGKIILGSATPSIESWFLVKKEKYQKIVLSKQATKSPKALVKTIELDSQGERSGVSKYSEERIRLTLDNNLQVLVYINRKGWAPILGCRECGWAASCIYCEAHMVLHKKNNIWTLICHHCGSKNRVSKICPECSNMDIQAIGKGTEKIEVTLERMFPKARIVRMDRQRIKGRKLLAKNLSQILNGGFDIIVGTQMMAKGHDFPKLGLVLAIDVDSQLKNTDFRAPERLFASLIQVAGRAGRHFGQCEKEAEVVKQTRA